MSSSDTIANIRSLSTAQRSLTPSKIPARNSSTPQRPSSSNPRNATTPTMGVAIPATAGTDRAGRASSRSASRRKQRRWENQHVFSTEVNDILMQGLEDEDNHVRIRQPLFKVEMKSAFKELFLPKNAAALEAFRLCAEKFDGDNSRKTKKNISPQEKAWLQIENRLRKILIQSVIKNIDIMTLIADVEETLIAYAKYDDIDDSYRQREESTLYRSLLLQPPSIGQHGDLEIEFKDSPFHRLLLHTTCQFHGLNSKSFHKNGTASKITIISKSQNSCSDDISLTNYLFTKVLRLTNNADEVNLKEIKVNLVNDLAQNLVDLQM